MKLQYELFYSDNLKEYLLKNSSQILESCKRIVKGNLDYGSYLGYHVMTPNMESSFLKKETELYHILQTFFHMNSSYYYLNFELHIKDSTSAPTPLHSDKFTWLMSDKYIVNQAWILLYNDDIDNYKNIDLYENENCGLLHGNDDVVATLDGYVAFVKDKILDGKEINIGDVLLFQNGVIHGTDPMTDQVNKESCRIALAISYYKHEWKLTNNLVSYYYNLWVRDDTDRSKKFISHLNTHPYAIKIFGFGLKISENPVREEKIQDLRWFDYLKGELVTLEF